MVTAHFQKYCYCLSTGATQHVQTFKLKNTTVVYQETEYKGENFQGERTCERNVKILCFKPAE